ncbi:preprotein translocase subunit SecE [Corynebacterium testudinoris]|uniref:Protein translocase subunit SecE n=1 Tax=Corynebacterium testudinoris TaxID=136857 RepID=A0A0G3H516_9CORY|nr:preprotein translocase subunit SecE [Corynebacterium testudinoris]AKK07825.1 protein translocase subunit secE/sec61 gamma [Corynebacterium testudinoris]MBX8996750.1 preprotein translocase subunit SecE [Corynebacterium testudinoris]
MAEELSNPTGAGAARPTGKRQLTGSGAGTTTTSSFEAKNVAKPATDDSGKPGGGVAAFLPEVVSEVRKVIWPTARQMVTYTLVVFAFLIVVTALVSSVDFLAGAGVEKILSP